MSLGGKKRRVPRWPPAHRPKQGTVTNVLSVTLGIDHGHCLQTMATTKVRCRAELGSWVRNGNNEAIAAVESAHVRQAER